MDKLLYYAIKYWIKIGLHTYYKQIGIEGLQNIPKGKPILFLSNHQNALLDILIIATHCSRKPWYLTRSDVFKGKMLKDFFRFLQMLPIYRIRDGKAALAKNAAIFDFCGQLLSKNKAILLFPEANHNLKRRVRPLSKGFTRLLQSAFLVNEKLEMYLQPVGQNYKRPTQIGDSCKIIYGEPIAVSPEDVKDKTNIETLKSKVSFALKNLTVHVPEEDGYELILNHLETEKVDYLSPAMVNKRIQQGFLGTPKQTRSNKKIKVTKILLAVLNLPVYLLWKFVVKPKVPEPEFLDTFRFMFALLAFSFGYLILFCALIWFYPPLTILIALISHYFLNFVLIKVMPYSSN